MYVTAISGSSKPCSDTHRAEGFSSRQIEFDACLQRSFASATCINDAAHSEKHRTWKSARAAAAVLRFSLRLQQPKLGVSPSPLASSPQQTRPPGRRAADVDDKHPDERSERAANDSDAGAVVDAAVDNASVAPRGTQRITAAQLLSAFWTCLCSMAGHTLRDALRSSSHAHTRSDRAGRTARLARFRAA